MSDRSFLDWPFFEDRPCALAEGLDAWAAALPAGVDHADTDAACRPLVAVLGAWAAGWQHSAPMAGEALDVRTLCLIRETLARHDGLADFAFAMQGLGTGRDHAFRHARAEGGLAAADAAAASDFGLCTDRTGLGIGRGQFHHDGGRATAMIMC